MTQSQLKSSIETEFGLILLALGQVCSGVPESAWGEAYWRIAPVGLRLGRSCALVLLAPSGWVLGAGLGAEPWVAPAADRRQADYAEEGRRDQLPTPCREETPIDE